MNPIIHSQKYGCHRSFFDHTKHTGYFYEDSMHEGILVANSLTFYTRGSMDLIWWCLPMSPKSPFENVL